VRYVVLALCAIGLYVSFAMQAKAGKARRGELVEASVVQTPRATIFGNVPNSLFGIVYYTSLAASTAFFDVPVVRFAAVMAAGAAGAVSVYLAYSLLFVTRMPCFNCWTGHVVNWTLVAILLFAR